MSEHVTLTALRERARVSSATARRAVEAANIQPDASGKYPLDAGLSAIDLQRSPDKSLGRQAAGRGATTAAPTNTPAATLAEARARSEIARAKKLEIENLKAEQSLLDKDTVIRAGQLYAGHMRSGLLTFGPAVAPSLVGLPPDQIADRITNAMRDLLTRLGDVQDFVLDHELK